MAARGAGLCLAQRDLSEEKLADTLRALVADREGLRAMAQRARELGKPDAADRVAEEIIGMG